MPAGGSRSISVFICVYNPHAVLMSVLLLCCFAVLLCRALFGTYAFRKSRVYTGV